MTTRILLTHPACFLTQYLTLALLNVGYTVRVAPPDDATALKIRSLVEQSCPDRLDLLEFSQLDMTSDNSIASAMDGCNVLFHSLMPIAHHHLAPEDRDVSYRRDCAMRLLRAAHNEIAMRQVVVTSSISAATGAGRKSPTPAFTEADWGAFSGKEHARIHNSIILAERALWDYMDSAGTGLGMTTLLAGSTFGPLLIDEMPPRLIPVRKFLNNEYRGIYRIGFVITDVRDLVETQMRVIDNAQAQGERFIVADQFHWHSEIAALLRHHIPELKQRIGSTALPGFVTRLLSVSHKELRAITPALGKQRRISNQKLKERLGVFPRPAVETLVDTARSILALEARQNGPSQAPDGRSDKQ